LAAAIGVAATLTPVVALLVALLAVPILLAAVVALAALLAPALLTAVAAGRLVLLPGVLRGAMPLLSGAGLRAAGAASVVVLSHDGSPLH
jgi:hypothetical protein